MSGKKLSKNIFFAGLAMIALGATSCQQSGGKASMPSDATPGDSLMFYLGQLEGERFKNEAMRDTTLQTLEGKKAYLEGVRTALGLPRQDDEAYNLGLNAGFQQARNFNNFDKEYEISLNRSIYLSSLTATVMSDSSINSHEAQTEFSRVLTQFRDQKDEAEHQKAKETLSQEAAANNLPKITDDLYGKVTQTTDSVALKDGDMVNIDAQLTRMDGTPVNAPLPHQGRIGARNMLDTLRDALEHMKSGETAEFMTTGYGLFGARAGQFGLEANEPLKLTIKASVMPEKDKDNDKK